MYTFYYSVRSKLQYNLFESQTIVRLIKILKRFTVPSRYIRAKIIENFSHSIWTYLTPHAGLTRQVT
jgi:hypothetical protein